MKITRYVCSNCNNSFYFNDGKDHPQCSACKGKLIKQKSLIETCMDDVEEEYFDGSRNEYWLKLEKEYLKWTQLLNEATREREEVRRQMIDEANGLNIRGVYIQLTQVEKRGQIQYNMIPELKTIDLEQYRGPSSKTQRIIGIKDDSPTT